MGSRLLPPPFLLQDSASVLLWLPDQGRVVGVSDRPGGQGGLRVPIKKSTQVLRGQRRDGGGESPSALFLTSKMDLFRKSKVPKLQFRICGLWRITRKSGEERRSLLSCRRTGSWGYVS